MEFDWQKTIQAREILPDVLVVQWLGMFWLEIGRSFHSIISLLFTSHLLSAVVEKKMTGVLMFDRLPLKQGTGNEGMGNL